MPRFVIEREIPGAGKLTAEQLQGVAAKSCGVLHEMGPDIQWLQSFVTDEKTVREHAKRGGFPASRVSEVRNVIDPITAEKPRARA